jgi:hypothetical protein
MSTNNTTNNRSGCRNNSNSNKSNTDINTVPVVVMAEWFWSSEKGWHVVRAEATEGASEWPSTSVDVDPETILWHKHLADSRTDGLPKVADVDLELVDALCS